MVLIAALIWSNRWLHSLNYILEADEADNTSSGLDCFLTPEAEDEKCCAVRDRVLGLSELTKKLMTIGQQWH